MMSLEEYKEGKLMRRVKFFIEEALIGLAAMLVLSFIFSFIRMAGHDAGMNAKEHTPCVPLFIDKLEPLISTRWFCEIR